MRLIAIALLAPLLLVGCAEEDAAQDRPSPAVLTDTAVGHYCQMLLVNHDGPKAQIHIDGQDAPLWFAQVRDALAYLRSGERSAAVTAVYVNDMGAGSDWAQPGADNWIVAETAFFVVGSDARGGMGAPEAVPFSRRADADAFTRARGGDVHGFDDIPDAAILAPVPSHGMRGSHGS